MMNGSCAAASVRGCLYAFGFGSQDNDFAVGERLMKSAHSKTEEWDWEELPPVRPELALTVLAGRNLRELRIFNARSSIWEPPPSVESLDFRYKRLGGLADTTSICRQIYIVSRCPEDSLDDVGVGKDGAVLMRLSPAEGLTRRWSVSPPCQRVCGAHLGASVAALWR
eukprot:gnl/TRDRNA2_/TRDRNA2_119318_c0_seq1.p1 gnl/TRDRNA2_/TRDRNA2_119318_c0~~gnl/TRDRNA2_/TRDRNA2_119318_c0_seq1.p1  ORF type:complete len:168 (-),score=25.22 gnl/TRDRNA2_/TRDRNA2_119318_c0_seq1:77-580(-)